MRQDYLLPSGAPPARLGGDMAASTAHPNNSRAWKILLLFRKAYVLLVRRGWPGRWKFRRGVLRSRAPAKDLEDYELTFPELTKPLEQRRFHPRGVAVSR